MESQMSEKLKYCVIGVGDGIHYGVYSYDFHKTPFNDAKLISSHDTLKEAMKAIDILEKK